MSKLNDLLTKLCPNGVPYRKLGEVAEIKRGRRLTKKQLSDVELPGTFPVFHGGLQPIGYYSEKNRQANTVMITNVGASAGTVLFSERDFWSSDGCFCLSELKALNPRFVYHYLKEREHKLKQRVRVAGIPTLDADVLKRFEIPLPPLPVQLEVVRILDAFTELEAELEAELAGRKEQYEYYRDYLLDEKNLEAMDGKPVETMKLGEIGFLFGGLTGKTKKDFTDNGNAKFVQYTNIYNNRAVDFSNLGNVSVGENERQNAIQYGDILITCSSETLRDCGMTSAVLNHPAGDVYLNSFCFGWRSNGTVDLMPQFMSYLMRSRSCRKQIIKTANGVTRFNVSKSAFKQIELPVPSLATQERVVDILDRFDALTTSLTDGIPAEIAMRREQYEYYRARILDFPRVPEDSDSNSDVE